MFKKLKLFIFSFLFIFGGLQAEIEYDIFVLADEHHEFSPSKTHQLTEDDYILGRSQKWTPLVYHFPSQTFFELSNIKGEAVSINRNGLVAGTFSKNNTNDGVFVYNIHTHEFVDVLNHPDLYEMGGHFIVIGITDDNTVFVRSAKGAFSYNYDLQTVTLKIRDTIKAVNGNGQTMGGGFSEISLTNDKGWFLDPGSEYDDLGSIHELGRLPVLPLMMSENGFVAGTAYESDGFYPNRKAFIWNKETGLIKVDVEMVDFLGMAGINNKGEVVGSYDDQIKEKSGAFLITAEKRS